MTRPEAIAVIGAGWGDEGKGHLVDALAAASEAAVVVRFNGGAQAGHTVVLEGGRRHVFHHLGAGALAGARTHLSRHFVHHPMLLRAERDAVTAAGGCGTLSADGRGVVTTPWDMLINQAAERVRGAGRHGSCGLGFGETIERNAHAEFALTVADLVAPDLEDRLRSLRRRWVPARLAQLGVRGLASDEAEILANDDLEAIFLEDCRAFADGVEIASDGDLGRAGRVIFEGAQGLQLDQSIGAFPHVTRSHTGLVNVLDIAREAELEAVHAVYVTRAYATRHGAGPLPGGGDALEGFDIVDPTNQPNPWQGRMRYAVLDIDRLGAAIAADGRISDRGAIQLRTSLFVTCLDQAPDRAPIRDRGETRRVAPDQLAGEVGSRLGMALSGESWGPERNRVHLSDAAPRVAA
jgi:adenylosuccinate synthase